MPSDIDTSRAFVKERTKKTRSAQVALAADPSWIWPLKTLAQWEEDMTAMDAAAPGSLTEKAKALENAMLSTRGLLDLRLDFLHQYTLLTVGVMRVRAKKLPGLAGIVRHLSARGDGRRGIEQEADELLVAWEEWESQMAEAFRPAPGKTLADFQAHLEGGGPPAPPAPAIAPLRTLKKNYLSAQAKWRASEGLLNAFYARCEDDCVGWYAEATKVFPEGTAEGDMIRSGVPTSYSPPTPVPAEGAAAERVPDKRAGGAR